MQCPNCKADTQVFDTVSIGDAVIRRRKCKTCPFRFVTKETVTTESLSWKNKRKN